jgi:hypothetical protein
VIASVRRRSDLDELNFAAALLWIVGVLRNRHIQFQLTGGLAARLYGARRPLVDIDIDVLEEDLPGLGGLLASSVVFGPARLRDGEWDVELLTVSHRGISIDLGGTRTGSIFDRAQRRWVPVQADLSTAVPFDVLGVEIPVVCKQDLIAYKRRLDRDVDRLDVAALGSPA